MIYRVPPSTVSKWRLKLLHTLLHLLALLLSGVGLKSVWDSKGLRSMNHAYSLHSWLGIASVLLFALQFIAGFAIFLLPPAPGYIRVCLGLSKAEYGARLHPSMSLFKVYP